VTVIGADDHAGPETGEIRGMLMSVTQGPGDQDAEHGIEADREPGSGLEQVAVPVVPARKQLAAVRIGRQRLVMLGIVPLAGGTSLLVQDSVENPRTSRLPGFRPRPACPGPQRRPRHK
jgi:hypothetical protein